MSTKQIRAAGVGAGAVALAVAALGGCGGAPSPSAPTTVPPTTTTTTAAPSTTTKATPSTTSTTPTTSPTTGATSPTGSTTTPTYLASMPIYFVGQTQQAFRLFREFRTIRKIDGPVSSAVSAMTRLRPLDPDYANPWRPASRVQVGQQGKTLTVDLSADAFANRNVGSELAALAVQQLVYTATAAAHVAGHDATSVVITVDGKPADVWGVVHLGSPMTRAPMLEVQAQAWVTSPQQGDVVPSGTVRFTGYGTSFDAVFHWEISNASGTKVAHGEAMGGSMGQYGSLTWSARLAPGTYTVRLATDDPSGDGEHEGHGAAVDTKTFTVR